MISRFLEQNERNLKRSYANGWQLRARAYHDITTRVSSRADVMTHTDAESIIDDVYAALSRDESRRGSAFFVWKDLDQIGNKITLLVYFNLETKHTYFIFLVVRHEHICFILISLTYN